MVDDSLISEVLEKMKWIKEKIIKSEMVLNDEGMKAIDKISDICKKRLKENPLRL